MLSKYDFKLLFLILILSFKIKRYTYLPSGIKTLNKFLYYSRVAQYYNQTKIKTCSLSDGPNCYFTEEDYTKHYIRTRNENKKEIINHEWVKLYSKIKRHDYLQIMKSLFNNTTNYINTYSKEIDEEQNPKKEKLEILMTFDNFDVDTIKEDIFLGGKISEISFEENIIAEIKGKLRLSYDKDYTEKLLFSNVKDYPSKTFGIIESEYLSIAFKGKLFRCNFFYIKPHNEKSKSENILFYGYMGQQLVYTYGYADKEKRRERWLKIVFPDQILINKLVISGPYDIDNISFSFSKKIEYDENEIYYMYNYKNIKTLVNNEDI